MELYPLYLLLFNGRFILFENAISNNCARDCAALIALQLNHTWGPQSVQVSLPAIKEL